MPRRWVMPESHPWITRGGKREAEGAFFTPHPMAASGGGVRNSRCLCHSSPVFPAADSAPAAQDFNKKHFMESNVLSGLHYRARASLDPVVPYDFISDEPYLLSKRFHLNSINLSKLSWASSSQPALPGAGAAAPGTEGHAGPGFWGLGRDPPAAPCAVQRVPGASAVIRRDGSASSSSGSVYAIIEPVCTAESLAVTSPLAVSLCAVQGSPGLCQDVEGAAEVSLIPGLFPPTLIPTLSRVSCRSRVTRKQVVIFSDILHRGSASSCRQIQAGGFIGGGKAHGAPVWFPCCARSLRLRTDHAFQI
ncbi:uncharacterized protein LOC119712713 isoform X2 [Motacilla alba alba]|nr:uncharacterized protein LOC119712713 isoform X2 [Motacilla alba alba]